MKKVRTINNYLLVTNISKVEVKKKKVPMTCKTEEYISNIKLYLLLDNLLSDQSMFLCQ